MIQLAKAIAFKLGRDVEFDNTLNPSSVAYCSVPLGRFPDAAYEMKKANALLAGEWASDETPFGRGFGVYACFRWGGEYLIVRC